MGRPCTCDRTVIGGPFVRGRDCGRCWLWHNHPPSRSAWEGVAFPSPRPPCVHLGPVLEWCTSCGGNEGRHVRDCDLHDRCTLEPVGPAVRNCRGCEDYRPEADQ